MRDPGLDAAAGHPDGERARMMIASHQPRAAARLVHRRAAEFAAPDHERGVEQAALLEIPHERGRGAIGLEAELGDFRRDVGADAGAVGVPAAVIELHEPHAALDQAARQQAVVGERHLARLRAVQRVDRRRLARDVGQLRHAALHPVGHLVRRDARVDLRIAGLRAPHPVQVGHEIDRASRRAPLSTPSGFETNSTGSPFERNSTP